MSSHTSNKTERQVKTKSPDSDNGQSVQGRKQEASGSVDLKIPVRLLTQEKEVSCYTQKISAEGLQMMSDTPLSKGTPLALQCSFGEVCYLNLAGQVVSCQPLEAGISTSFVTAVKFARLREWERKILDSVVEELKVNADTLGKSALTMHIAKDSLALEAAEHGRSMESHNATASSLSRDVFLPRHKGIDFTPEAVNARRDWLERKIGVSLEHIAVLSEAPEHFQGNIENLIGVAHVPLGIAGPLKVNGQEAQGIFYVPMATTEGAIVYTYMRGMHLVSLAGGVNVWTVRDEIHISPIFVFENLEKTKKFTAWLDTNFERVKEEAEKTTRHGKLLRLESHIFDRNVVVKFCYSTGDAMGLNMINIATEEACKWIVPIVRPEEFYLRSNFSSVKKVSAHNYAVAGLGKMVIADVTIPRSLLRRLFKVSPETLARYCHLCFLSSVHAGMVGMNGHIANGLAAIFIACGQDVANIVDSQVSVSSCEVTKNGDLYVSMKIPNLVVGTVGGGVSLEPQRECLQILGCYGSGKARKFAEIVAASVLAGEIGVAAAIVTGTFVSAHKKYGRKPITLEASNTKA
jgi:hydroxymethylglutaryl-CoA reductase (NADPH)